QQARQSAPEPLSGHGEEFTSSPAPAGRSNLVQLHKIQASSSSVARTGRWSDATAASALWCTPAARQVQPGEWTMRSSGAIGRRLGKLLPSATGFHDPANSRRTPLARPHWLKSPIITVGQSA